MATIDILTVLNIDNFPDNNATPDQPEGQGNYLYSNDQHVRLVSNSDRAENNGHWNLAIHVEEGDVIRWLDTPITQGEGQKDMLIYNFHMSRENDEKWRRYFTPLRGGEFHSTRFYIDRGLLTNNLHFQYNTSPNNFLFSKVRQRPDQEVTLQYYLEVVKLELVDGVITPKGYYGIDPEIHILP